MSNIKDPEFRKRVLIAANHAFIGNITAEIRMISLSWEKDRIDIRVIFSRQPSQVDKEIVSDIMGEILAHFPEVNSCEEYCLFMISPLHEIEPFGEVLFMRKE